MCGLYRSKYTGNQPLQTHAIEIQREVHGLCPPMVSVQRFLCDLAQSVEKHTVDAVTPHRLTVNFVKLSC